MECMAKLEVEPRSASFRSLCQHLTLSLSTASADHDVPLGEALSQWAEGFPLTILLPGKSLKLLPGQNSALWQAQCRLNPENRLEFS